MQPELTIMPDTTITYEGSDTELRDTLEKLNKNDSLFLVISTEPLTDNNEPELFISIKATVDNSDTILTMCVENYDSIHAIMNHCKMLLKSHKREVKRLRKPIPDA